MTYLQKLLITTAILAVMPATAQAVTDSWLTTSTTNAWELGTNWSGGVPATTSQVIIGVPNNNPVQLNSNQSLNGGTVATGGSLTVSGSGESLNINSGFTLTMGAHTITLSGGSITGAGTVSSTGTITGYGTFSAVDTTTASWSATGTAGNPLILDGGNTYHGTFTSSSAGGFDLGNGAGNGVTLSSFSNSGTAGVYNLNNATINGGGILNNVGGQFYVLGNSTLSGAYNWFQYNTFNIGDGSGANTLNLGVSGPTGATLSTVSGGAAPFIIGAGGTLNNYNGASSMGGGGTVTMNGGAITNTSGAGGTTAGLFTVGDPISGYGTISGNVAITAGNFTAAGSGQTMTLNGVVLGSTGSGPGMGTSGGATLDLQGNISVPSSANMNPGTGVILLDGVTLSGATPTGHNINNSGLVTAGTFRVVNASTLSNIAFSTGNGASLQINAPLTVTGTGIGAASLNNSTTVTINSGGALNLLNTTGTTDFTGKNLTMALGSTLDVAAGHNGITLSGNFAFQQTDTVNAWTYDGTSGLGPDLTMTGGSMATPVTLEVGGVDEGNVPGGYVNNFALDSLTLGLVGSTHVGAYVELVDLNTNATTSGWVSGVEALYLDGLFGVIPGAGITIPTLNLDGLDVYYVLNGNSYQLMNGLYTDANGGEIYIVGAPEVSTYVMMLVGFACLGLGAAFRQKGNRLDWAFA